MILSAEEQKGQSKKCVFLTFLVNNCLNMDNDCPYLDKNPKMGQHDIKCEACPISAPDIQIKCPSKNFVRGGGGGLPPPNREFTQSVVKRKKTHFF